MRLYEDDVLFIGLTPQRCHYESNKPISTGNCKPMTNQSVSYIVVSYNLCGALTVQTAKAGNT